MPSTNIGPMGRRNRVAIVDILRGWALLGVVLMNYTNIYFFLGKPRTPDAFNSFLNTVGFVVFESKSWTLLSILFGYGFAVLISNISAKGINPVRFFSRRMFWLLVIAFINSAIFYGDILKDYAVLGMMLLLFRRCTAKTAFYISLALLVVSPVVIAYITTFNINGFAMAAHWFPLYSHHNLADVFKCGLMATYNFEIINPSYSVFCHVIQLSCFLLGLAAQKINFFDRLVENKKCLKRICWVSFVITLMLWALTLTAKKTGLEKALTYYPPIFLLFLSSMICIASTICWLFVAGKMQRFFAALQVYGRMTLTNYLVQNILGVILFSGAGFRLGMANLSYGACMLIALAIYVAQIYFSRWWLSNYDYGPTEWLWRQLSYGRKMIIKKEKATELSSQAT
jgi:uncharacterized protein